MSDPSSQGGIGSSAVGGDVQAVAGDAELHYIRAAVVTVSDRSAAGERPDDGGPLAVAALREAGFLCDDAVIVPDGAESVAGALSSVVAAGAHLVVTTGGTGVGPRDETPEGTRRMIAYEVPGVAEELRRTGAAEKPAGMLSRGVAGIVRAEGRGALVVNLPGAPAAVRSGMPIVLSVASHVVSQLEGGDHDGAHRPGGGGGQEHGGCHRAGSSPNEGAV